MHRLLMNSAVYQQGGHGAVISDQLSVISNQYSVSSGQHSVGVPAESKPTDNGSLNADYFRRASTIDPENRLLSRFARRRLEAEAIRDSILFVSGTLDFRMGGSLLTVSNRAYVTSTASRLDGALFAQPRRSTYLPVIRSSLYNVFQIFDFADPSTLNGHREQTTVAPQALFMLNSKLVADASRLLADSLLAEKALGDSGRIEKLYRAAYGRLPTVTERVAAGTYLERFAARLAERGAKPEDNRLKAWQSFVRTVLAANEFIYVE